MARWTIWRRPQVTHGGEVREALKASYSRIADGYKIDQTDYVKMLKAPEIEKEIADDHPLNPSRSRSCVLSLVD